MSDTKRVMLRLVIGLATLIPVSANAQTFQTLSTFPSGTSDDPAPGGAAPVGGLIKDHGYLYGTTSVGGNVVPSCGFSNGCGTVFRVNIKTGKLTTLYKFCTQKNCAHGAHPLAGLVSKDGVFYGTTEIGGQRAGQFGAGTVFKLTPPPARHGGWTETVLHSFCSLSGCADGNNPSSLLVFGSDGLLYGTTAGGPPQGGFGTVFKLDPTTGVLTTLYTFSGGADGSDPVAGVVFGADGALYGTTQYGGISTGTCGSSDSNGTVFRLDPVTLSLTTILAFPTEAVAPCWPFGRNPIAALLVGKRGVLYGSTAAGGDNGSGTLFQMTPLAHGQTQWTETVLHSFCVDANCTDGGEPSSSLVLDKSGLLYGTTLLGGTAVFPDPSTGTVFELDPASHALTTLFNFTGVLEGTCPDCVTVYANGDQPAAALTIYHPSGGGLVLYGTAQYGGSTEQDSCYVSYNGGCGTVFALTP